MTSHYLNRWTQPDTIIPDFTNPQSLNRYTYNYNNPVNYIDPTGHWPAWFDNAVEVVSDAVAGAVYQAVTSTRDAIPISAPASAQRTWNSLNKSTTAFQVGRVIGAAVTAAAGVASIGTGIGGSGLAVAECATGLGCAVGIPQAAISASLVTAGAAVTASAVADLIELGLLFSNGELGGASQSGTGGSDSLGDDLEYTTQDLIDESVQSQPNVWRNSGNADDAKEWFYRLANPDSIGKHPNFQKYPDGLSGHLIDGGRIYYRPTSKSGPPTLDLSKAPNLPDYVEIKFISQ